MSHLKDAALQEIEIARINDVLEYDTYCLLFDALEEIEPLAERDEELEVMWADLQDVVFDDSYPNEDMKLIEPWNGFPAGTSREDIWRWFDERHSKGVYHLLYSTDGVDRTKEIATLVHRNGMCQECLSLNCVYNGDQTCKLPLVTGNLPDISDEYGCFDYVFKE